LTAVQTVTIEGELRAAVRQRVTMTTDISGMIGTRCRLTAPVEVRLPWGRTFEVAFDFTLRCDRIADHTYADTLTDVKRGVTPVAPTPRLVLSVRSDQPFGMFGLLSVSESGSG